MTADPGRAVVVGGGISGLVAARELLSAGWTVTVVEANSHLGGCVSTQHLTVPALAGAPEQQLELDAGAESFALRVPAVPDLVAELGLGERVQAPNPAGSWLYLPQGAVPAPRVGILGIPGDLDAPEVAQAIGRAALERARQDLEAPVDRWRQALAENLAVTVGELVRDRLGQSVLESLVAPVVAGVHSADPEHLDIRTVAPRLLEALVEHGSLVRAVAAQRAAAPPGAAVASLAGGLHTLTDVLVHQVRDAGARLLPDTRVERVVPVQGGWQGRLQGHDDAATAVGMLQAERLVVATDGPAAWDLLAPISAGALPAQDRPAEGSGVALVTLVVDHPGLDAAPRGTGLLVAPSVDTAVVAAKAMTHSSAKWDWARQAATAHGEHPHRHVLRLSYGRVTDAPDSTALGFQSSDEELIAQAVADAAVLTGLSDLAGPGDLAGPAGREGLAPGAGDTGEAGHPVVAADVVRWRSALPVATPGHREKVTAFRTWVAQTPGLDAVGAWLAGTGLAAVVGDARRVGWRRPAGRLETPVLRGVEMRRAGALACGGASDRNARRDTTGAVTMTENPTTPDTAGAPAEAASQEKGGHVDWFTTYTVFARDARAASGAHTSAERERAVAEFESLVAELEQGGVTVRGTYDVSGMRADADLMVWMYGHVAEDLQAAIRRLRRTELLSGTRMVLSAMGSDRTAEFNKDHIPAFAMGRKPLKWLCFYPFVRSYDWYTLEPQERGRMLRDHGLLGREFPMVWANTTSAFALNDWEWLLGLEAPELNNLVDMMRHLRNNETRHYVREEVPFYTGRLISAEEIAEVLA